MIISPHKIIYNTQNSTQKLKSDVNNKPMRKNSADSVSFSQNTAVSLIKSSITKRKFVPTPKEDFVRFQKMKQALEKIKNLNGFDENKLFQKRAATLEKKTLKLRNQIVTHNLGLARKFARRDEDKFQILAVALIKAVEKYNPNHPNSTSFSTYFKHWMKSELFAAKVTYPKKVINESRYVREEIQNGTLQKINVISTEKPIGNTLSGEPLTVKNSLKSTVPNPEELIIQKQQQNILKAALKKMETGQKKPANKRDSGIFKIRTYDEDKTLEQIGNPFGITKNRVRQICQKMFGQLKQIYKHIAMEA